MLSNLLITSGTLIQVLIVDNNSENSSSSTTEAVGEDLTNIFLLIISFTAGSKIIRFLLHSCVMIWACLQVSQAYDFNRVTSKVVTNKAFLLELKNRIECVICLISPIFVPLTLVGILFPFLAIQHMRIKYASSFLFKSSLSWFDEHLKRNLPPYLYKPVTKYYDYIIDNLTELDQVNKEKVESD